MKEAIEFGLEKLTQLREAENRKAGVVHGIPEERLKFHNGPTVDGGV